MSYPSQKLVTVCSSCLTEPCLRGVTECRERVAGEAGTVAASEEHIAGLAVSAVEAAAEREISDDERS